MGADPELCPALEDALGAGAVLDHLGTAGTLSVEAAAMVATFRSTPDVAIAVRSSGSAWALVNAGFADDVEVAFELDCAPTFPVLDGEPFMC